MEEGCKSCKQWEEHFYWDHFDPRRVRFSKILIGDFSRRLVWSWEVVSLFRRSVALPPEGFPIPRLRYWARSAKDPRAVRISSDDVARGNYDSVSPNVSIPEKFTSRFKEKLSEIIDLKGPGGHTWHVGLTKIEGDVFLQYGWKEFVDAHHLVENDNLVFKYEGNSRFSVLIFDASGCEKESSYFVKHRYSEKQEMTEEYSLKILEPNTSSAHEVHDCSSTSSPNGSTIPEESSPSNKDQRGESSCARKETQNEQNIQSPKSETVEARVLGNRSGKMNLLSRRRPVTDAERDCAFQLARAFKPVRPSFLVVMKGYNVYCQYFLVIPQEFAKKYLPKRNLAVILRLPRGKRRWKVNYCVTKYACRFIGKWRNFARDNILEEGDVCVLELLGDQKHIAMMVHIFRVVKEVAPPARS